MCEVFPLKKWCKIRHEIRNFAIADDLMHALARRVILTTGKRGEILHTCPVRGCRRVLSLQHVLLAGNPGHRMFCAPFHVEGSYNNFPGYQPASIMTFENLWSFPVTYLVKFVAARVRAYCRGIVGLEHVLEWCDKILNP